ncbi:hypothetical protein E8E11_011721 [Didymella keratinophila]|nr:hypothetical protein E8E11_011721 [Didymella keratinophila]
MALKHLLDDDDIETRPVYTPQLRWDDSKDSGFFDEPDPVLPYSSWHQCVSEILAPDVLNSAFGANIDPNLEAFQLGQGDIEQWVNGPQTRGPPEVELSPQQASICYGTVFRVSVKLLGDMLDLDNKLGMAAGSPVTGHCQMQIISSETRYHVAFADGTVLGEVNVQLEEAFNSILEQQYSLEFEVFAPTRAIRETISRATKEKDAISRVQINIYGSPTASKAVGRELSQRKIYLQRPEHVGHGVTYDNPHVLKLGNYKPNESVQSSDVVVEPAIERTTSQVVKETVTNIYSALTRGQHLVALEGDRRLRTSLLFHQKRALDFMSQRENGPISPEFLLWRSEEKDGQKRFRHAVTGMISRLEQTETGGGILADEMGMGKTLSVLALILRTLEMAHSWAIEPSPTGQYDAYARVRSRATLVVASSDLQ